VKIYYREVLKVRVSRFFLFLTILSALLLAGTAFADAAPVPESRMKLIAIRGEVPIEGTEITILFGNDGILSGGAGCNAYTARYEVLGGGIKVERPATTKMFCSKPEGIMMQENAYLDLLEQTASMRLYRGAVEFFSISGEPLLLFSEMDIKPEIRRHEAAGRSVVTEVYPGGFMVMKTGGRSHLLFKTGAPSGVKYEARGDADTFFWEDGSSIRISTRGGSYPAISKVTAEERTVKKVPAAKRAPAAPVKKGKELEPADSGIYGVDIKKLAGDKIALTANAETFIMKKMPSASGERYVAEDDPNTVFWRWEGGASLMIRGRDYGNRVTAGGAVPEESGSNELAMEGLAKGVWKVRTIAGKTLVPGSFIKMRFDWNGTLSINCTVHSFTSSWAFFDNKLTTGRMDYKKKSGKAEIVKQEALFFETMDEVREFDIIRDKLVLKTKDGKKIIAAR
jgi:heat shock protein HslJ